MKRTYSFLSLCHFRTTTSFAPCAVQLRKVITLIALACLGVGQVWGTDQSITPEAYNGQGGALGTGGPASAIVGFISIASTKAYYTSAHIREYKNGTITISSSNTITSVVVTGTTTAYANAFGSGGVSTGTWNNGTWTGSATTITFTTGDQARWTGIVVTYTSACTNTVTVTKGSETNGTFTLSATEVCADAPGGEITVSDITPAAGYQFSTITATNGTVDNTNRKVTGITAATTIGVTFEEIPKYTVTTYLDGNQIGTVTQATAGAAVTLAPPAMLTCTGYTFAGWSTTSGGNTAPEIAATGSTTYTPTANTNLYAVYSKTEGGGSTTATLDVSTYATTNSWANGEVQSGFTIEGVTFSQSGGGNNGKYYTSDNTWRFYDGGTVNVSATGTITSITSTPFCEFTISGTTASCSLTATTKFTEITVIYESDITTYTTSPVCGPSITTAAVNKLTSTKSQSVVSIKGTVVGEHLTGSTISGTISGTDAAMFAVTLAANSVSSNAISTTYTVTYTPTDYAATHTAKLVFSDGSNDLQTDTIILSGRSLPQEFAVVATDGTNYWALDGSMSGTATRPAVLTVTVSDGAVTQLPTRAVYSLTQLATADTTVYLVGTGGRLWGSGSGTELNNKTGNAVSQTAWYLSTEDLDKYHVINAEAADPSRGLMSNSTVFGHYAISNYGKSGYYGDIYFLPITVKCTCLDAPTVTVQKTSTTATLTWEAITGASTYAVTCSGGTVGTVSGTSVSITGLSANTAYTYTVKAVASGADCSQTTSGAFTTSACDDVPVVTTTAQMNSITFSWTCTAASSNLYLYSDREGTSIVVDSLTITSPCTVSGLEPSTSYYYCIAAGGTCRTDTVLVATQTPDLDIVEWSPDSIIIELNTEGGLQVLLENEVKTTTKHIAKDIFFSKYYEASSNVKMLGIYNGTESSVDMTKVRINVDSLHYVVNVGDYKSTLKPGEEVILYGYQPSVWKDSIIMACAANATGFSSWIAIPYKYVDSVSSIVFGGKEVITLERQNNGVWSLIDVIGARNADGSGNTTNQSMPSWGDGKGWYCEDGRSISDGSTIALSTNRCLLVRDSLVLSGDSAIAKNVTDFATLCTEWKGLQVERSSNHLTDANNSCDGFSYVGSFNYGNYYQAFDSLTTKLLDDISKNPDGTYTLHLPDLDTLSCSRLRIRVINGENVITSQEYKVPIMVQGDSATTDHLFSKHGSNVCKECDVVVMRNSSLTKAADNTTNDMDSVRNLEVYPTGKLIVPTNTTYTVKSLAMRAKGDSVPSAVLNGTLRFTQDGKTLYHDKRIDATRWYFMTLPYNCAVADVTFSNGKSATKGTDWEVKVYDGAKRAETAAGGCWAVYNGDTLYAGVGYVVAIEGTSGLTCQELRFPMNLGSETAAKTAAVKAYGATVSDLKPNHKGWNLIGNPYMDYYKKDNLNSSEKMVLGMLQHHLENGKWDGTWELTNTTVPYVTVPQNGGKTYTQVTVNSRDLEPFISYFVQIDGTSDGQELAVAFAAANRRQTVPAYRVAETETDEQPIWVGLQLAKGTDKDQTTLVISDNYTTDYEIGGDLAKMLGYSTIPQVYSISSTGQLAFNALPKALAEQAVPLGYYAPTSDTYTFSLDWNEDLSNVESVWLTDNVVKKTVNLMQEDYAFTSARTHNTARFAVAVKIREQIITPLSQTDLQQPFVMSEKGLLRLFRLPEKAQLYVYDAAGKLFVETETHSSVWHCVIPVSGVYYVRIVSPEGNYMLKTVVR